MAFELMLDGTDEPDAARRAEVHLRSCAPCAAAWVELRRVRTAVAELPEGKPSSSVVYALLAAAGVPPKPKATAKPKASPKKKTGRRRATKGIIALLPAPMLGLLPGKAAAAAAAVAIGSSLGLLTGMTFERVIERRATRGPESAEPSATVEPAAPAPAVPAVTPTVERHRGGTPTVFIASIPRV